VVSVAGEEFRREKKPANSKQRKEKPKKGLTILRSSRCEIVKDYRKPGGASVKGKGLKLKDFGETDR